MRKGIDMTKSSNNSAHRQIPRLSLTLVLVIALFLSMLFTVYLLVRLNDRNQKIIQDSLIATPNSSAAIESGQANEQVPYAAGSTSYTSFRYRQPDCAAARHAKPAAAHVWSLEQKSQSAGYTQPGGAAQSSVANDELPALWVEISSFTRSCSLSWRKWTLLPPPSHTRSASEMIALKTQVNPIHQRLSYLFRQVKSARNWSNNGSASTPVPANIYSSDQVMLEQLYQNMVEMQNILGQVFNNKGETTGIPIGGTCIIFVDCWPEFYFRPFFRSFLF